MKTKKELKKFNKKNQTLNVLSNDFSKQQVKNDFEKKKYGFFGDSAVQVCEWNKKAIRGKGHCYKQDFYGVDCISCHQITPLALWCNNSCVFCWRPKEYMAGKPPAGQSPEEIIKGLREARAKQLSGFGGSEIHSKNNFENALKAKHWAISLSGEPTLYKKLPELVKLIKKQPETETVFIVTNGENPNMISKMKKMKALPTQLYLSMVSPEELLFKKITCNAEKNGWKKYLKTIKLFSTLPCRTVVRLTLIKGLNDSDELIEKFAKLISQTKVDFVEIKSYMWIGYSRQRLVGENMPTHEETKNFARKLLDTLSLQNYTLVDEKTDSRIVLLAKKKPRFPKFIIERK
jgi:tRNA wybutosine-synthesizing protein 1